MTKNKQIFSTISKSGQLALEIIDGDMPTPDENDVVVRMEAAPINPSDMFPMFGTADMTQAKTEGNKLTAPVSEAMLAPVAARLDQRLPVGNEGGGTVVATGNSEAAKALDGKRVGVMANSTAYSQFVKVPVNNCLPHKEGTTAEQAASSFVNPMTALCFLETLRMENHKALIHTAAASNLGQMLVKLCQNEDVPLVNIVRNDEQMGILQKLGGAHIIDSTTPDFFDNLVNAIDTTGATLGFDAIGGGKMANIILTAMERSLSKNASGLNTYGSTEMKQVYIYGGLDLSPTTLNRGYGMSWSVGGWLMPYWLARIGLERTIELRKKVADEISTTFASSYTAELSLAEAIDTKWAARYLQKKTGEKYIINPHKDEG